MNRAPRAELVNGFDFHCHIDLHPDPVALIADCERQRVAVIAVTTTPRAWPQNNEWMHGKSYVYPAIGLHPELVAARYSEVELLEEGIKNCRLVGEIGLDGSPQHQASLEQQRDVLARALTACTEHGGRIATIHSRRAARDTIALIETHVDPARVICILHWFSGSTAEAHRAIDAGCYFSVNASMLDTQGGRNLVRAIPADRLLTETDAPFGRDGLSGGPLNIGLVLPRLASLLDEPASVCWTRIRENGLRAFQFAGISF